MPWRWRCRIAIENAIWKPCCCGCPFSDCQMLFRPAVDELIFHGLDQISWSCSSRFVAVQLQLLAYHGLASAKLVLETFGE